jgi:predicted regulator of Ras-like GTPase activity (Roadblock/LC7/MglB family)
MANSLEELLGYIQSRNALNIVAVVGMDGLVIGAATSGDLDAEAIAAVAAPGTLMMSDLAQELGQQTTNFATLEYGGYTVAIAPLNEDSLLVVVAAAGALNLGQLRIVMRRNIDRVRDAVAAL